MEYMINVEDPRVRKAMISLGIQAQELQKKSFEDFGSRNITSDIQTMRYKYYTQKQESLVSQIKSQIAENKKRLLASLERQKLSTTQELIMQKSVLITQDIRKVSQQCRSYTNEESSFEKLERIKQCHQKKISKVLEDIQNSFKGIQAIENKLKEGENLREKFKSVMLKKLDKQNSLRERQKEKLTEIKSLESVRIRKKRSYSSLTPKMLLNKRNAKDSFSLDMKSEGSSDYDVEEMLGKYYEKMNKSKEIYDMNLDNRRKAAARLWEKAESTSRAIRQAKEDDVLEKINRYVMKNKAAEQRRSEILQKKSENLIRAKQLHIERRDKANIRAKEREMMIMKKARAIEKRMEACSKIAQQKHEDFVKELELRQEFHRLRDEDALTNAERKRRIL